MKTKTPKLFLEKLEGSTYYPSSKDKLIGLIISSSNDFYFILTNCKESLILENVKINIPPTCSPNKILS